MRLLVVGAGGHAKVVINAAEESGLEIAGVVGAPGDAPEILGHPVLHDAAGLFADAFVVAIGDNATRSRIFTEYLTAGFLPASVVHPSAIVGRHVLIGDGAFVAAGVVINAGAHIGTDAILNTGCTVDHDSVIGDHAHIGPQAALCGSVTLGEGVLLGVGSCAAPGVSVGDWTIVGAGAAIVDDLPAHAVCVGVPARPVRSPEEPVGD